MATLEAEAAPCPHPFYPQKKRRGRPGNTPGQNACAGTSQPNQNKHMNSTSYTIVIHGTGTCHSERIDIDGDQIAKQTITRLEAAGHRITHATFASGNETKLLAGSAKPAAATGQGDLSGVSGQVTNLHELVTDFRAEWRREKLREQKDDKTAKVARGKKDEAATPKPATTPEELPPGEPEGSPEDKQPGDAAQEGSETTTTPEA